MNSLVLEDSIDRISEFKKRLFNFKQTYTDSALNAIYLIENNKYDIIFLDHDLDNNAYVDLNDKNTGSEVARWIGNNKDNINKDTYIIIHSLNTVGANYMKSIIPNSIYIPFVWTENVFNNKIKVLSDKKRKLD